MLKLTERSSVALILNRTTLGAAYHYKTNSLIISRIIRLELVVDYQPDYHLNYQLGSTEVPAW